MCYTVRITKLPEEPPYEGLEINFELNGTEYCAMGMIPDCCAVGDIISADFGFYDDSEESWESMFNGNMEEKIGMTHIEGWEYQAFGRIVSIKPIIVDVGDYKLDIGNFSNDERLIGEYVNFHIQRLDLLFLDTDEQ